MQVTRVDWRLDVRYPAKAFAGEVSISIEDSAAPLTIDARGLGIDSARLDGATVSFREDPTHGTIEFSEVPPGSHRLAIVYHGEVAPSSLVGLYASPAGERYVLTTMLFPTGAGRLLPAFERPSVKTVYHLTLTVEAGLAAIFNTPARSERAIDGRREIVFEPTPPMSAYLLYLGVGPFDTLTVPGDRWSVTVAASPGRAVAGRYCAERATELLAAYEEYYGAPYPLPKLDLVALEDFWAGAMENWGAIAFRESAVLVDPTTSALARRSILQTLAHEIAHQWFGNLVTPVGWDDFWLNESFATFVGHRIVARRYPEEDSWTPFLNGRVRLALEADALTTTHPIHVPVDTVEALGEISDQITYGKGAAVLRMTEAYLGEETFRTGVSRYLERHRYGNATAADLWDALSEVSDLPVSHVLSEWITRPGYPVLHASWADGRLTLRQERFRADGTPSPGVWPIPLAVRAGGESFTTLFESAELVRPLSSPRGLCINPGRTAFVRTHLDAPLFGALLDEYRSLDPIDQWGAIVDTHALVYAGLRSLEQFLRLVGISAPLAADLPVRTLVACLSDLRGPLYDVPDFLAAARRFLAAQRDRLGLEPRPDEAEGARLLRETVAFELARVDPGFARTLADRFASFDALSPELRGPVAVAFALREGGKAFEPLVARLRATTNDTERLQMVLALASVPDPATARNVLAMVPSPEINPSKAMNLLLTMTGNPSARPDLLAWYRDHAEELTRLWAGTPLQSIFLRTGLADLGIDAPGEVERYFVAHPPADAVQATRQGLESLRLAARLRQAVREGPSASAR